MKLLTNELKKELSALYAKENEKDPLVICKFFLPMTKWTWYATEFDGNDIFFGYVAGDFPELGYFSLKELEEIEGPYGLGIERDMHFKPTSLSKIKEECESKRRY